MKRKIRPVHPGRILRDEFMEPAGISQYRLAQATGLSQVQVGNIIRGKRGISAETALRLERALGMSAQTWMNLQTLYELEVEGDDVVFEYLKPDKVTVDYGFRSAHISLPGDPEQTEKALALIFSQYCKREKPSTPF